MGLRQELQKKKTFRMNESEHERLVELVDAGEYPSESEAIRTGLRKLFDEHSH